MAILCLSFRPSAAPFAPRKIRSLSRAVRTGTRRSSRTRGLSRRSRIFFPSPINPFLGVAHLSRAIHFNLEANVSDLFGIDFVDDLHASGLKLHPESLNNKVRTLLLLNSASLYIFFGRISKNYFGNLLC